MPIILWPGAGDGASTRRCNPWSLCARNRVAIVNRLRGKGGAAVNPMAVPVCLVAGHAPFAWGKTPHDAAHNAVVLEAIAKMAFRTVLLKANAEEVSQALLDRHYFRKHGTGATYGQSDEAL
jgi:L-ribulose-5-phosphate 4-epimerase